jgi:thiamine pyrophosphate-dependent acetolactate synthase large subunit-like protein
MSEIHGGRIAARQLKAAGVDTIFGVVAGPMIEVFAGAQSEGLRVVGCRHEENAAFMASAWGYLKRKPGVIVAGSGPGMTNTVTPMHVATASGMPLVVLGGSAFSNTRGIGAFQEADQLAFAQPGCKWTGQVDRTERIGEWLHLALGRAVNGRPGATYLDFPGEVVARKVPEESARLPGSPEISRPHPDPDAIARVADLLARAERPLVVIGKGAAWADAGAPLARLVSLGIPYVTSPMGRGVVPDDDAHFVNAARSAALRGADAILVIGARLNWIFGFGRPPRYAEDVRIAQIDITPEEFVGGANLELGVVADAAVAAERLCQALEGRRLAPASSRWLQELREQCARNEAGLSAVTELDSVPINPYRLVREVRDVIGRDANVSVDGETIMGVCRTLLPSYRARCAARCCRATGPARA